MKEINNIITANAAIEAKEIMKRYFSAAIIQESCGLHFLLLFLTSCRGINFILYYAPEILSSIGLGAKESLANSIAIGGTNLIFTFVGLYLIDRHWKKNFADHRFIRLYYQSCNGGHRILIRDASPGFLMTFLLMFIAAHAIGQGAVIWVFIAEIFPNKVRALGQSFGASTHWIFAAIITLITPVFLDKEKEFLEIIPGPYLHSLLL